MNGAGQCILFDWGDTLMRDFKDFDGPMTSWPVVEAMPFAHETLETLWPKWVLGLATNAQASDETQIRAALERVDLNRFLDRVYCYRKLGIKKPAVEFYTHIVADLGLAQDRVIMVGDDYEADIAGAAKCGLHTIWYRPGSAQLSQASSICVMQDFRQLPDLLDKLLLG